MREGNRKRVKKRRGKFCLAQTLLYRIVYCEALHYSSTYMYMYMYNVHAHVHIRTYILIPHWEGGYLINYSVQGVLR